MTNPLDLLSGPEFLVLDAALFLAASVTAMDCRSGLIRTRISSARQGVLPPIR